MNFFRFEKKSVRLRKTRIGVKENYDRRKRTIGEDWRSGFNFLAKNWANLKLSGSETGK